MWVEVLCFLDCVWSSKECAYCACDPSVHLSVPSIGFVCICVCRKLSPRLRAASQVFALLTLFLCVSLHTMWSGKKEHAVARHLTLCYVVLVCHQYDVCKHSGGSVYVGLNESRLYVFHELCTVEFLVVGESPLVLL